MRWGFQIAALYHQRDQQRERPFGLARFRPLRDNVIGQIDHVGGRKRRSAIGILGVQMVIRRHGDLGRLARPHIVGEPFGQELAGPRLTASIADRLGGCLGSLSWAQAARVENESTKNTSRCD